MRECAGERERQKERKTERETLSFCVVTFFSRCVFLSSLSLPFSSSISLCLFIPIYLSLSLSPLALSFVVL